MVLSGYEGKGNDCSGDGRPQMAEDDTKTAGEEHTEGHSSSTGETVGDAEIEAFGTRQEGGPGTVGHVYFVETEDGQFVKMLAEMEKAG
jgi:hypothetical protein